MTVLRPALVLGTTEDTCTVVADKRQTAVPYAPPFPRPRVERVLPGHLVALAAVGGADVVVWRWFDAVVLGSVGAHVRLWEPTHGEVLAMPRDPRLPRVPGSRAYLSAGLPGADWQLDGPAVDRAEDAAVELDEVACFLIELGLWDPIGQA